MAEKGLPERVIGMRCQCKAAAWFGVNVPFDFWCPWYKSMARGH